MIITILTDNDKSWFVPYGKQLEYLLNQKGHYVKYVFSKDDILEGDICFLLSCSRIIQSGYLDKNKNNIVVHASDLPKGKGFAPMQWQIIEGFNEIVLTLFEVVEEVDAGPFYFKSDLIFNGIELYDELRKKLALKIIEMCIYYVDNYNLLTPKHQKGTETYYPKRTYKDDQIDPKKSIVDQFNHFRIADNNDFPLWFDYMGKRFIIKIYEDKRNHE